MTPDKEQQKHLDDLKPKEQTPEQGADIKGGIQPPHGLSLTTPPPLDPPNG